MNEATLHYIHLHAEDDVRQLALRGSKEPDVDLPLALQQIAGRQTARRKLPSWADKADLLYPSHLALEQCSSEQTAKYKQSVCRTLLASLNLAAEGSIHGKPPATASLVDLTGGFGIDFSFLAPLFSSATYVEQQDALCRLAEHNFKLLNIQAEVVCSDGVQFLHHLSHATLLFLDPARRNSSGGRTYAISDCTPDVLSLHDELLEKADFVMLKLSPMLDWRKTVSDLGQSYVREIHIVATGNECKELLVVLSKKKTSEDFRLVCLNDNEFFEIDSPLTTASTTPLSGELTKGLYLYEPNAAIMKGGCFSKLAQQFKVSQIAPNSHLFVSRGPHLGFPGRKFRISDISSMNKKELKEKVLPLKQANITIRNFPLSVAELRKRLKLNDGGDTYLFATTLSNGDKILLICEKLNIINSNEV